LIQNLNILDFLYRDGAGREVAVVVLRRGGGGVNLLSFKKAFWECGAWSMWLEGVMGI